MILLSWLMCAAGWGSLSAESGPCRELEQAETGRRCGEQNPQEEPPLSRHEELRKRRLEKAKSLQPHRPEFFEKLLARFDRGRFETGGNSNYRGFYPRFARIAEGSGLAGGLSYLQPKIWGDVDVSASAFYSVKGYRHFEVQMGLLPNRGKSTPPLLSETEELDQLADLERGKVSQLSIYATGRRRFHPQVSYFGAGPESQRTSETDFLLRDNLFEITLEYQLGSRLLGRLDTGFLQHSLGAGTRMSTPTVGELFDESSAPGLNAPPHYWRVGGSLVLDYRDNSGVPHKGFALALGWSRYDEVSGQNQFNFRRYEVDARGFVPLGSRQRGMALRFRFVNDRPAEGNRVPFFLQLSLGGSHTLRGFDRFRFRGDKLMLYQAEYRWEPSRRFELALFADAGAVAGSGSKLSFSDLESDFGVGFRVRTSRATVFRLEQAWSREASKTVVSFSASF